MRSQAAVLALSSAERRRSQRLFQVVPLVIRGELDGKKIFWEDTFTSNVSAHGALMILSAKVGLGQKLVLMNPQTWQEEDALVARLGACDGTRTQVGVEFNRAIPDFWPANASAAKSPGALPAAS
jgi:hypothetical protein